MTEEKPYNSFAVEVDRTFKDAPLINFLLPTFHVPLIWVRMEKEPEETLFALLRENLLIAKTPYDGLTLIIDWAQHPANRIISSSIPNMAERSLLDKLQANEDYIAVLEAKNAKLQAVVDALKLIKQEIAS